MSKMTFAHPRRNVLRPAPRAGTIHLRRWYRGVAFLLGFLFTLGIVAWYGKPIWYFALLLIWLWNIWDAIRAAGQKRVLSIVIPILIGFLAMFGIGWHVVGVDFSKADINRAIAIMRPMFHPDFIQKRTRINSSMGGGDGPLPARPECEWCP